MLLVLGVLVLGVFVYHALRKRDPILDLRILRQHVPAAGRSQGGGEHRHRHEDLPQARPHAAGFYTPGLPVLLRSDQPQVEDARARGGIDAHPQGEPALGTARAGDVAEVDDLLPLPPELQQVIEENK